jgi:alkylhydroperoxidase/carboxymuconolactone decarboxylase family protein YurZ
VARYVETLQKLAIRDDEFIARITARDGQNITASGLDPRTHSLLRVAALVASDAGLPSYIWSVENARRHGVSDDQIVGVLVAVIQVVGSARVVAAAPELGLAVGYDVRHVQEHLERDIGR